MSKKKQTPAAPQVEQEVQAPVVEVNEAGLTEAEVATAELQAEEEEARAVSLAEGDAPTTPVEVVKVETSEEAQAEKEKVEAEAIDAEAEREKVLAAIQLAKDEAYAKEVQAQATAAVRAQEWTGWNGYHNAE